MTEKRTSKTSKLKNFLVTGSIDEKEEEDMMTEEEAFPDGPAAGPEQEYGGPPEEEVAVEDIIAEEAPAAVPDPESEQYQEPAPAAEASFVEDEIAELKKMISDLTVGLEKYTTSKEQLKEYSAVVSKRDAELANRKFIGMLEQLSAMREDFFKLCSGINAKLDSFSPKEILGSFEAYGVDMENILVDCGVEIGRGKLEKLNTMHQRIVDIVPTDDESKNGMIAERVSDG